MLSCADTSPRSWGKMGFAYGYLLAEHVIWHGHFFILWSPSKVPLKQSAAVNQRCVQQLPVTRPGFQFLSPGLESALERSNLIVFEISGNLVRKNFAYGGGGSGKISPRSLRLLGTLPTGALISANQGWHMLDHRSTARTETRIVYWYSTGILKCSKNRKSSQSKLKYKNNLKISWIHHPTYLQNILKADPIY